MEKTYKLIQHLPSNEGVIQIFAYHDAIPSRQFLLREFDSGTRLKAVDFNANGLEGSRHQAES